MKNNVISIFLSLSVFFAFPFAVFATHDLGTSKKVLEKPVVQKGKGAQTKASVNQKKKTALPSQKTQTKKTSKKQPVKTIQKKTISKVQTPKDELSSEIIEISTQKGSAPMNSGTQTPSSLQNTQINQQKDAASLILKQAFLDEMLQHAQFLKTQTDVLMTKIQQNPNASDYLDGLRKQQGISELQDQFKKLQEQIDAIEKDIRTLPQDPKNIDIAKILSLQKTKFPLLQQQETLLQQIDLKESFVKQIADSTKREYDFNTQLYNTIAQKYMNEQALIQKLKQEIDALQKNETQKSSKTT